MFELTFANEMPMVQSSEELFHSLIFHFLQFYPSDEDLITVCLFFGYLQTTFLASWLATV